MGAQTHNKGNKMKVLLLANMQMKGAEDSVNESDLKAMLSAPFRTQDKQSSPLITHSSCQSKDKAHILAHNKQEILSIDIDDGHYTSIEQVNDDIQALGIQSYCVYTTASHNPSLGKFKYRAVIPLDKPIGCAEFTITQLALAKLFQSDDVVSRIQQILYCPAIMNDTPSYYEYIDNLTGEGFNVERSSKLMETILEINEERKQAEALLEEEQRILSANREARKQQIAKSGREQLVSVFDLCNEQFTMKELLTQYGFKKKGSRYLHPNSSSGLAGVIILDGHYFSHHSQTSDELADGKSHSCFDLIKYWEYNNNQEQAIDGLSDELMVGSKTLREHNDEIKKSNHDNEIERHNAEMHNNLRAIAELARDRAEDLALSAVYNQEDPSDQFHVDHEDLVIEDLVIEGSQEEAVQTTAIQTLNASAVEIDVDSDEIINFDISENIIPTKTIEFDMLKPSGIVQRIIEEICIRMHRSDPALAVAPALYIAMRAGLPTIENSRLNPDYDIKKYGVGLSGFKVYLNLLTIGISASGKEKPQQLLNATLNYLGDESYGRIASDKDLAISLIDSIGSCCCVIDEAGGLFSSMREGKNDYMKNLAGAMMQYATAQHSNFDGLIKRGLKKDYQVAQGSLTRALDKIDEEDQQKAENIKKRIEEEIRLLDWKIEACEHGIDMPQFAMLASSTPTDMKGAISLDSLNTGQMSRYLMFVGKSDVDPIRERVEGIDYSSLPEDILGKLWWIKSNAHTADDYALHYNAKTTYDYIFKWFESRRNHTEFSVLYRRGFETVVRLASILAVQDRIVTIKHLEWAFCLVRANIESFVITCASQNEHSSEETKFEIAILSAIKSSGSLYSSTLKQRLGRKKEWVTLMPFFERAVESLVQAGFIEAEGKSLKFTGKNSIDRV